jgi:hypothetical protein
MKFKYLLIAFLLLFPILYLIGYVRYLSNTKSEELVFNIPIVDDIENRDTIILKIELRVPRYYNFRQYIRNESDCITCGNQQYVFFKNPEKQTIEEGDSVRIGFYKMWEDGRERDKTLLSINTYKNVFTGEILEQKFSDDELILNSYEKIKSWSQGVQSYKKRYVSNNGNNILCLDFNIINKRNNESCIETSINLKNIPISIILNDLTLDGELKEDFYKIVNSMDFKMDYTGNNEELIYLFNNH